MFNKLCTYCGSWGTFVHPTGRHSGRWIESGGFDKYIFV